MLLSYTRLMQLVADGVVAGVKDGAVNGSTIDVHLGNTILTERPPSPGEGPRVVRLMDRESVAWDETALAGDAAYLLQPGEIILAHTLEVFNLTDSISAEFMMKSSSARNCLDHLAARWCDPTWHSSVLTLEIKNVSRYHQLELRPGMPIGQMKFYEHDAVPHEASYAARGHYNGDRSVSGIKQ